MALYFVATHNGVDYLRSTTGRVYAWATLYQGGDASFHEQRHNAGRESAYGRKAIGVVPARQVDAAEFRRIQKAQRDARPIKQKIAEAKRKLLQAQRDQAHAGRALVACNVFLATGGLTEDAWYLGCNPAAVTPGRLAAAQADQASAYRRIVKHAKALAELRAQAAAERQAMREAA